MLRQFLTGCLFLGLTATVNAAIEDLGTITRDTDTGLEWLDVTQTTNLSYDYVSSQLGAGGAYEGWLYATGAQVNTLIANFTGVTPTLSGQTEYAENTLDALVALVGNTWTSISDGGDRTYGMLADSANCTNCERQYMATLNVYPDIAVWNLPDSSTVRSQAINNDQSNEIIGSFLVRRIPSAQSPVPRSVPEAQSILLFGLGLLGLFGAAQRKV